MQGASGLAKDTYKFAAVSLTLASVCTALAQVMQVTSLACMQLLTHISTQFSSQQCSFSSRPLAVQPQLYWRQEGLGCLQSEQSNWAFAIQYIVHTHDACQLCS